MINLYSHKHTQTRIAITRTNIDSIKFKDHFLEVFQSLLSLLFLLLVVIYKHSIIHSIDNMQLSQTKNDVTITTTFYSNQKFQIIFSFAVQQKIIKNLLIQRYFLTSLFKQFPPNPLLPIIIIKSICLEQNSGNFAKFLKRY